jgi:hypothetical protein
MISLVGLWIRSIRPEALATGMAAVVIQAKQHMMCGMAAVLLLLSVAPRAAQATVRRAPARVQALIIEKALRFDRRLTAGVERFVGVITPATEQVVRRVMASLAPPDADVKFVTMANLAGLLSARTVVYTLAHGVEVGLECARAGALSLTGEVASVEAGHIALGVGLERDRPVIWIHWGQLQASGHGFASSFLRLVRVVGAGA